MHHDNVSFQMRGNWVKGTQEFFTNLELSYKPKNDFKTLF